MPIHRVAQTCIYLSTKINEFRKTENLPTEKKRLEKRKGKLVCLQFGVDCKILNYSRITKPTKTKKKEQEKIKGK